MKQFYLTLSALLTVITLFAQANSDISREQSILKQALIYGDSDVATNTMYQIIAKEGATSTYKDSLAYLYFSGRRYSSCFMVCTDILSKNSDKQDILEMQAISLENLMAFEKAAQVYAKLVTKSNNNYHAYKLANLYYALKKYDMAQGAIQKAQQLKDNGEVKVTYAINQNYSQEVSLLAAISNLKGLIETALDKKDAATASFQKALELQPDFVLAKENLEAIKEGKAVKKE